jgi:hypothetical protein
MEFRSRRIIDSRHESQRMTRLCTIVLCIPAITLIASAQTAPPPAQGPSIAVSLELLKTHIPAGQKPTAILTIENISHSSSFSTASSFYRVHIEGKDGGPPETEWQRHRRGDFRPGDGPDLVDGPVVDRNIAPGTSAITTFDLTAFYDLSAPGEYTVYMEYLDAPNGPSKPGVWLRTNTVRFEIGI